MTILAIIFATAVISGLSFWFYNRRQITNLSETIEDKNAVIGALKNHVEPMANPIQQSHNDEWRGNSTRSIRKENLTPTVKEATGKGGDKRPVKQNKPHQQPQKPNKGGKRPQPAGPAKPKPKKTQQ